MRLQGLFVVFDSYAVAGVRADGVHFEERAHRDECNVGHFVCGAVKNALIKLSSVFAGFLHEEGKTRAEPRKWVIEV